MAFGYRSAQPLARGDASRLVAQATGITSIAAGVIHISAAGDHTNLPVMAAGFISVASLQGGLGVWLLLGRALSRPLLAGAMALMLGSVGMWLMSRTIGLPFLPGGHMEPIGFKDGVTVLFELACIPGLALLLNRELDGVTLPSPRLGNQALGFLAAASFALFMPALLLGGGGHHSAGQMAAGGHEDGAGSGGADHHGGAAAAGDAHAGGGHEQGEEGPFSEHADGAHGGKAGGEGHHEQGDDAGAAGDHGSEGGGHGDHGSSAPTTLTQGPAEGGHEHDSGGGGHGDHDAGGGPGDDHGSGGGDHGAGGGHGDGGHGDHGSGGDPESGGEHGDHGKDRAPADGHGDHGSGDGQGEHGSGGGDGHGEHGSGGGHGGNPEDDRTDPPLTGVATQRAKMLEPKAPGTKETIKLQYGPYEIAPGGDANQIGAEFIGVDGYIVSAKPKMRFADGSAVSHDDKIHLHHAHLFRADRSGDNGASSGRTGAQWVFGSGGEQTQANFELLSQGDPSGKNYGLRLFGGDPMLMVWMPMNMSSENKVAYLEFEFEFEFVHGTPEEIKQATGKEISPLRPILHGTTFNVPKTGGAFSWPLDISTYGGSDAQDQGLDLERFNTKTDPTVKPGVGDIWTAPSDGMIVGAAGHMHEGGSKVVFNNLGSEASPCPSDSDKYPGTTVFESKAYYPKGVFPTHMVMGTTQTGWRVYVKKGDRIATNGVYDTRKYAFPDQMSVVGMYYDDSVEVKDSDRCKAELVNEPDATQDEVIQSIPGQDARRGDDGSEQFHATADECVAEACDNNEAAPMGRGPQATMIEIEDFKFSPGDMKQAGMLPATAGPTMSGAPVVWRGDKLLFVNRDYAAFGGTRHAITSCSGPCNGPDVSSYPNSDGLFYSGPLGYTPLSETSSNENQATPTWELDTSKLDPGYHTFYCFQHRWMRGAFYVEERPGGGG